MALNDGFKIVDGQSLYNIRKFFNDFVEALGQGSYQNLLQNPRFVHQYVSGGVESQVAWKGNINFAIRPFNVTVGSYFEQVISAALQKDEYFTIAVELKNTFSGKVEVLNGGLGVVNALTLTPNPIAPMPASPLDDFGNPMYQTVVLPIKTSTSFPQNVTLRVTSDGVGAYDVKRVTMVKGMFGLSGGVEICQFFSSSRYATDGTRGWWEVTTDGTTYNEILTTDSNSFEAALGAMLGGLYYTRVESDEEFIKKQGDTALGRIAFAEGATVHEELRVGEEAPLVIEGRSGSQPSILVNEKKDGTFGSDFILQVDRGSQLPARIRYSEFNERWEYSNGDGVWRPFGSGTGGTASVAGDANSEVEYYAEILNGSGMKYAVYDLFSSVGGDGTDVVTSNLAYDAENTSYFPEGTNAYAISCNVFPADHTGFNIREIFVHALTDNTNSLGLDIFYSMTSDTTSAPSQEHVGWVPITQNIIKLLPSELTELYLKFEWQDSTTRMYSFGVFYGRMSQVNVTSTRIREYMVYGGADGSAVTLTVPNGAIYTNDGKSLEVYLNRVRLIPNVDYFEVSSTQVKFVELDNGDHVEFHEKYTYAEELQTIVSNAMQYVDVYDQVALREFLVIGADMTAGSVLTVPNGQAYNFNGKALELYVNRIRMIRDPLNTNANDYAELNATQVRMNIALEPGDIVEFYQKYGYVDVATENTATLVSHLADTTAHGLDTTEVNSHIAATVAHGLDADAVLAFMDSTALQDHIDSTSPHPNMVIPSSGGFGTGQQWTDMSGVRSFGFEYMNDTSTAIMVNVSLNMPVGTNQASFLCRDNTGSFVIVAIAKSVVSSGYNIVPISIVVPPNKGYFLQLDTGSPTIYYWSELR